jgi:hypothetical protein
MAVAVFAFVIFTMAVSAPSLFFPHKF